LKKSTIFTLHHKVAISATKEDTCLMLYGFHREYARDGETNVIC